MPNIVLSGSRTGRLPDNVSFEQGAGIWTPYATAYRALFQKAKANAGESVLIHGASGRCRPRSYSVGKKCRLESFGTSSSDEGKSLSTNKAPMPFSITLMKTTSGRSRITDGKGVDLLLKCLLT